MAKAPIINQSRTLGPVADLEKHLPSDWWKTLFNSLYLKTDGDVVENSSNTDVEVDMFLQATQLGTDAHILDLCCGQGRHVLELQKRGYTHVSGLDRSRYLIRIAKKRAAHHKLAIKFSEGDARKIRYPESSLDCVVLFGNSFGYFESQEDDFAVLNAIKYVLKDNGSIVMDIVNGEWMRQNYVPRTWEWIDDVHFVCRERTLSKDRSRIISREVVVHADRGVIADQFYAERLYTFTEIKTLLEDAHFTNIEQHTELQAVSTRGHDLGMMENRMLITAAAPMKVKREKSSKAAPAVFVLLGDPRLDDKVKLNGRFNDLDLDTVQKLKEALKSLNVKAKFLDNHSNLMDALRLEKPEFVLNFCDEGYFNDASKELHVPALLDILDIPYSGAAPACLAMCYNKSIVRAVAESLDIPVPLETYYDLSDQAATLPSIFPALIKPNLGDSSIGITKNAVVHDSESLVAYIEELKMTLPNIPILIQEYLSGDEYSVGVIGNPGNYTILPTLTVDYSRLPENLPQILGYESKWQPDSPYWQEISYSKADISVEVERQLADYSTLLFERLGCRDYARFDYRRDSQGQIKLLEVNPNPGWCWDGKLNLMAGFCSMTYTDILAKIIEVALDRVK